MKKNKKLFAILTLVAFMMTLMPVMAFAADDLVIETAEKKGNIVVYTFNDDVSGSYIDVNDFEAKTTTSGAVAIDIVDVQKGPKAASSTRSSTAMNAIDLSPSQIAIEYENTADGVEVKFIPTTGHYIVGNRYGRLSANTAFPAAKATLQPTPAGTATEGASIIATKGNNVSIESFAQAVSKQLDLDTKYAKVNIALYANNNAPGIARDVYVWAEESGQSGFASDALVLQKDSDSGAKYVAVNIESDGTVNQNVFKIPVADFNDGNVATVRAAFVRANANGFVLKASFTDPTKDSDNNPLGRNAKLTTVAPLGTDTNKEKIVVVAPAQETRNWTVDVEVADKSAVGGYKDIHEALADGKTTDNFVQVAADTVATTEVKLTLKRENGDTVRNYPIRLSTNSANIELDETNISADYSGVATFNVAGLREGEYKIYVTVGDYESTIKVRVGATSANNIQLIKFPSNPIATDTLVEDYDNIFRFQLTDANGNIVKGNNPKGALYASMAAPSSDKDLSEQAKYAAIISAPEANKVKNADLYLKYVGDDKDYYTLGIANSKAFEAEGDYEVRVVLDNGKSATLNFTVKKFDKAVSLHIEYPTEAVELNSTTDIPDIYFLDANNVMKKANNRVLVAASGYAVAGVVESGKTAGVLTIKNDEKYIGQTVVVTAVSDKENLTASTTLTVADEAREVKLDSTRGQVNANNRVGFKVVDSTGKAVALGNDATVEVTAVVTNTGDADAKVSYSVSGSAKSDLKSTGTGIINLSSNKETTATVQIMVKVSKPQTNADDNNTGLSTTYYTGTETFTFGAEADKSVVMTIGSKEIVANNVPATIDVAPFIRDNRTFVPFRALVEAFGAEVAYDEATSTVTTKLDGKTVVLTVGSTVLTVNDETVTMDVAPYIVNDRVVVPVRFVGEAFGFTVEATQDAETGATASVVFYQK